KEEVFPYLLSYPRVNIWSAGCSTGEEAYTLAVMIKESGLLSKTRIYATDINSKVLNSAKEGIFNQHDILKNTDNYFESGGEKKLDNYYFSKYNKTIFHEDLRNIISVFSHNMTADASFIEAQLIVCSNVLIYFNEQLQKKVLRLFHESLCSSGFLILGPKERVPPDFLGGYFEKVSPELPVFRKINKAFLPAQKKTVPVKLIKDPAFCLV
ncbi:MAG: hypothetical protein OEZ34_09015, partial [Spirochaetia bacterium]|nr:hypothetical protein [Spirochaetia bacterium]